VADGAGEAANRWRLFGERVIYESPEVWLGQVDVGLPSRERVWQHVLRLHRSVAVVLLDGQGHVLLLWRHRLVQDRYGWELPGGQVDDGEDPAEAALRYLDEQTGYRPKRLEHLITFQAAAEVADAERVLYAAPDAARAADPLPTDEVGHSEWMRLASVSELIAAGHIWDAATVVGLLTVLVKAG
jgi:8-oxo-dGTP pyrophosphatase MutT (NUDIX family)